MFDGSEGFVSIECDCKSKLKTIDEAKLLFKRNNKLITNVFNDYTR